MMIAVVGSGAVGGYLGACLARAGESVTFIDVGAHLDAIRANGLEIRSPLGDFVARAPAEDDPARVGPVDLVLFTVKTYHNDAVLPRLTPLLGASTAVLTLQNGIDSIDQLAELVGAPRVLGGAAYLATEVIQPGVISQTGLHRRVVFGEVSGGRCLISERVGAIAAAFQRAGIHAEPVADARVPVWQKFAYLSPMAGFTAAGRVAKGTLWDLGGFRDLFTEALGEVEALARAEGISLPSGVRDELLAYADSVSPQMRTSLLIDLSQEKRLEVEALLGSVVRRGKVAGVRTPIMATLYYLLKPHERAG